MYGTLFFPPPDKCTEGKGPNHRAGETSFEDSVDLRETWVSVTTMSDRGLQYIVAGKSTMGGAQYISSSVLGGGDREQKQFTRLRSRKQREQAGAGGRSNSKGLPYWPSSSRALPPEVSTALKTEPPLETSVQSISLGQRDRWLSG